MERDISCSHGDMMRDVRSKDITQQIEKVSRSVIYHVLVVICGGCEI